MAGVSSSPNGLPDEAAGAEESSRRVVARTILPRASLEVSRIGLGLANMHLLDNDAARKRLLYRALDLGITHFDTSRFYSDGFSEQVLGKFLAGNRQSITIATKFGLLPTPLIGSLGAAAWPLRKIRSLLTKLGLVPYPHRSYHRATMAKSLHDSLRALRTDYIDVYMMHEPLLTSQPEDGLFEDLEKEKRNGTIRQVGVSGAFIDPIVERYGHFLDVIQTAESAWDAGRYIPDITHSLFSGATADGARLDADAVHTLMRAALARRPQGSVIVQTRNPEHLDQLASFAAGS